MKQVLLLALIVVIAAGAGLMWAVKNLPWWGTVAVVAGFLVAAKLLAGRLFTWALSIPFKWKGAVLKGAVVQVHSVVPANASAVTETTEPESAESDQNRAPREPYQLEVTVTPNPAPGKFTHWGPGELRLVKPESKLRPHGKDDQDDSCEIKRVEVQQDGAFKLDEGFSYAGPQRLKLLLAVEPGVRQLKFRYYFEEFGEVSLPGWTAPEGFAGLGQEKAA